jgi:arylsulfatase
VSVQEEVKKLALTAIDYPPMQDPASFNLDAVRKEIEAAIKEKPGN